MDNQAQSDPIYGIQRKTLNVFNDLKDAIESKETIRKLKELSDKELANSFTKILDLPEDHPNWEHNIAVLIGAARVHRSYSELYTIKEKTKS